MRVQITCSNCGSSIEVLPGLEATHAKCDVCDNLESVKFDQKHVDGILETCPCCGRKDFYRQKDFSRVVGVSLFVVAAILSIWTYGISLIVLYLLDLFLFNKIASVAVCYKCQTIFRKLKNMEELHGFNHEMNDRIIYSDHDFHGKQLEHH